MVKIFKKNIEKATIKNKFYRKVLFTTKEMQLVLMSLPTGVEIGLEKHARTTQFFRVESGKGVAIVAGKRYLLKDGDSLIVPANTRHNIISTDNLKIYTIYCGKILHAPGEKELTKKDEHHHSH